MGLTRLREGGRDEASGWQKAGRIHGLYLSTDAGGRIAEAEVSRGSELER